MVMESYHDCKFQTFFLWIKGSKLAGELCHVEFGDIRDSGEMGQFRNNPFTIAVEYV